MMQEPALRRTLSLTLLTFYGLGTILGAGIYVLVGKVAGVAGMYAPIAFVVAALIAALTGLSYAELGARFPRSAGEALYVHEGLRSRGIAVFIGWCVILSGIISAATVIGGSVGYVQLLVPVPAWLIIATVVIGLGLLASWGITQSVLVAASLTVVEVGGLLAIVAVGADSLLTLPDRLPELVPPPTFDAWGGIALGAFLAFYAFIGFEDMVNVAEEVKDPVRNLPRSILLAVALTTLLYLLVALVAVLTLPAVALTASDAPLALVYERHTGAAPTLISVIGVLAVINGALIQIVMAARVLYGMSREGWQQPAFARVHPVTRTPLVATAVITALVLTLALWLPVVTLAEITSFIVLIVFTLVNLALLRIKRRTAAPAGVMVFPAWVPLAGLVMTGAFLVGRLVLLWRA